MVDITPYGTWPSPITTDLLAIDEAKRLADTQPELARDPVIQAAINRDFETLFAGEKHDGFLKASPRYFFAHEIDLVLINSEYSSSVNKLLISCLFKESVIIIF